MFWILTHADPWMLAPLLIGMGTVGLHPLEHIVNVQWGEGLAVEFGHKDRDASDNRPHDEG